MNNYFYDNNNTRAFYNMAWASFAISFVGMIVGLFYIDADLATKGFLSMSYIFTITSVITLSKVIRDRHESERFVNKLETAKTEKFLNENSPVLS